MLEATFTALKVILHHQMETRNLSLTSAITKGIWAYHCLTMRAKMPSELATICPFLLLPVNLITLNQKLYDQNLINKIHTWAEALTEIQCPVDKPKFQCGCFRSFSHSSKCELFQNWWNVMKYVLQVQPIVCWLMYFSMRKEAQLQITDFYSRTDLNTGSHLYSWL